MSFKLAFTSMNHEQSVILTDQEEQGILKEEIGSMKIEMATDNHMNR